MSICAPSGIGITTEGAASNSIFGVLDGPFKINHAAAIFRRRRGSKVLHLAAAKPRVAEVFGDFEIVTENTNVPASGFHYNSFDQYLDIINLVPISGSLIPDPLFIGVTGIPTDYREIPIEQQIFTTFHKEGTPL